MRVIGKAKAGIFTLTALASLSVCMATAGIWRYSQTPRGSPEWHVSTSISHQSGKAIVASNLFGYYRGIMGFGRFTSEHGRDSISELNVEYSEALGIIAPVATEAMTAHEKDSFFGKIGFAFVNGVSSNSDPSYAYWWINMPCWFAMAVTAILPLWWVKWARHKLRVRRYFKAGLCLNCGYNPAGNISEICPECGENLAIQHQLF